MIVTEIGGGIAAVTTSAGNAAAKMNVLDDFFQIHVRWRPARCGGRRKKIFGGLIGRIGVTKDAIVLQHQLHFLRTQLQRQQSAQVLGSRDSFLLHGLVEHSFQIVIETVEINALLRSNNRFAVCVFGIEHCGQFWIRGDRTLFRSENNDRNQKQTNDERARSHVAPRSSVRGVSTRAIAMATAATATEITPASK